MQEPKHFMLQDPKTFHLHEPKHFTLQEAKTGECEVCRGSCLVLVKGRILEGSAIMQNMIFDSVFEVDSVLENKSDFLIVADSILNERI